MISKLPAKIDLRVDLGVQFVPFIVDKVLFQQYGRESGKKVVTD
jgi:hypothetical protein